MTAKTSDQKLWTPTEKVVSEANITAYLAWLSDHENLHFESYDDLWRWSVTNIEDFWLSIWHYFEITASSDPVSILSSEKMPGVKWFGGARLNYAENFFTRANWNLPAMVYRDETGNDREVNWEELQTSTAALVQAFRAMGVKPGDRIGAYLPNTPEAIIALLATASLGAIWSSCSPDFGSRSVLDRFRQIAPKVLITVDGYYYGGHRHDRRDVVKDLIQNLPSVETVIVVSLIDEGRSGISGSKIVNWNDLLKDITPAELLTFEQLPFDHPLWVLYSSGTTGLPKPIVHSHGGILIEHHKMASLHLDLRPGDRFFWYTSTGWMMWNFLVGGLLAGATIVLYNGSPAYPNIDFLWRLAQDLEITYFGTSAAFISACVKEDIKPSKKFNLDSIRALGSTGSPLTADNFHWVYDNINSSLALESVSGGTDLCTAFVGGCRLLPIHAGEIQTAMLGASVKAFDDTGQAIDNEVGELVITKPMPSMPIYFWNDPDFKRYLSSYFEIYPDVWRHGDWIRFTLRGSCIIYGRSDSTINRKGIRMGTSEIYQVVETFPEVQDSLLVDLEFLGRESFMALFVVLSKRAALNEDLKKKIQQAIRREISPHHIPNEIIAVEEVPYTLSGKKMEVPVRRILLGQSAAEAVNLGAMRNPESIEIFIDYAEEGRFNRSLEQRQ